MYTEYHVLSMFYADYNIINSITYINELVNNLFRNKFEINYMLLFFYDN